jgi:hypothetical protein
MAFSLGDRSRTLRGVLITAFAALLLCGVLAAPVGAAQRTFVSSNCRNAKFKPRSIVLACADFNTTLSRLGWSNWSTSRAAGRGKFNLRNPLTGKTRSFNVRVGLTRPRFCTVNRVKQFSRASVTFTAGRPRGFARSTTFGLTCRGRSF